MKRKIKFEAYRLIAYKTVNNVKKEIGFDFLRWAKKVSELNPENKTFPYYQEKCSMDNPEYANELWYFNFNRLRDTNIPKKIRIDGESEEVELDDDEYIGESALMIYDPIYAPKKNIIILQRNMHSLGVSGIIHYLNKVWGFEDNIKLELLPIVDLKAREVLNKDTGYKKIEIKLGNIEKNASIAEGTGLFNNIYDLLREYNGLAAQISIGIGRTKKRYLNHKKVTQVIEAIDENKQYVDKAQISYEAEDGKAEIVDLLDGKVKDFIEVTLEKKKSISTEIIVTEATYLYLNKLRGKIMELVGEDVGNERMG